MLRAFALTMLCFALVASSVTMAVARSHAAALSGGGTTTMVICSGYGVMTVTLDAEGNPAGPIHPCPECLAGLAAYLPPAITALVPVAQPVSSVVGFVALRLPPALAVLSPRVRGPPVPG